MDKNLKDITYFISFCIEQYMNEKGINEDEVISIFSEYGVLIIWKIILMFSTLKVDNGLLRILRNL